MRRGRDRKRLDATGFALLACLAVPGAGCGNRSPMVRKAAVPGRDLNTTGLYFLRDGDLGKAEVFFERALQECEAVDHLAGRAEALYHLGLVHREQDRFDEATDELQAAESLFRQLEKPEGVARSVAALATVHAAEGRLDRARREYDRALLEAPDEIVPEILTNLAMVVLRQGRLARARDLAEEAVTRARDEAVFSDALFNLARIYLEDGRLAPAEEALEGVLDRDQAAGRRRQLADTLSLLGELYLRKGELGSAEDHFERAAGVFESLGLHERAARLRDRASSPADEEARGG